MPALTIRGPGWCGIGTTLDVWWSVAKSESAENTARAYWTVYCARFGSDNDSGRVLNVGHLKASAMHPNCAVRMLEPNKN